MARVREKTTPPDFTLKDTRGRSVTLSDYHRNRHVVLVFARGFM